MFGALHSSGAKGRLRIAAGDGTSLTGAIEMNGPTWDLPNLMPLWLPGEVRGGDVIIPGVAGVLPYHRRFTVTGYSLPLIVTGQADLSGAKVDPDEYWENLEINLAALVSNIVAPPGTVAGTREAELTMPSGATRTASIHVLGITPGQSTGGILLATLDISIPDGVFS